MAWIGVLTNSGKSLFASWVEGTTFNFDAAEGGTGTVPESALLAQTALTNKKQNISIIGGEKVADGVKVIVQITAPATGYVLNQIGLFGSVNGGARALTMLFQNTEGVSIPAVSETPDFIYKFYGVVAVSNTGTFSLSIDTSAVVSQSTLAEAIEAHNSNDNAHAGVFIPATAKGAAGGVATLGNDAKIPAAQLPPMNYDPAGSAEAAKNAAIAASDPKGSAAAVEGKLNAHAADTVKHIEAAERTAWNAKETPSGAQAKADAAKAAAIAASDSKGSASTVQLNLNNHTADSVKHITSAERTTWNSKETTSGAQSKADTALASAKEYADSLTASDVNAAMFGTCANSATTVTKLVTTSSGGKFVKQVGARIVVQFTYANTAATMSLNVDGTGATVCRFPVNGTMTTAATAKFFAGDKVEFLYTGTYYDYVGVGVIKAQVTLSASGWTADSTYGGYYQNVSTVPCVADDLPIIGLQKSTGETGNAQQEAHNLLTHIVPGAGTMRFVAEEVPSVSFTVNILIWR